jgi:hypothetical protein
MGAARDVASSQNDEIFGDSAYKNQESRSAEHKVNAQARKL